MNDFYKQDVFFFVTTIAVVVLTLIIMVAAYYVLDILKHVRYIAKKARTETDLISEDLNDLRSNVRQQGFKAKFLYSFFNRMYKKHK